MVYFLFLIWLFMMIFVNGLDIGFVLKLIIFGEIDVGKICLVIWFIYYVFIEYIVYVCFYWYDFGYCFF